MTGWNWHKATTLAERARLHRRAQSFGRGPVTERGRKRLAKWRAQPPFDAHPLFQQRLEQAGLTEAEVLELLSNESGGEKDPNPKIQIPEKLHAPNPNGPLTPALSPSDGEREKVESHRLMSAMHAPGDTSFSTKGEAPAWT